MDPVQVPGGPRLYYYYIFIFKKGPGQLGHSPTVPAVASTGD